MSLGTVGSTLDPSMFLYCFGGLMGTWYEFYTLEKNRQSGFFKEKVFFFILKIGPPGLLNGKNRDICKLLSQLCLEQILKTLRGLESIWKEETNGEIRILLSFLLQPL